MKKLLPVCGSVSVSPFNSSSLKSKKECFSVFASGVNLVLGETFVPKPFQKCAEFFFAISPNKEDIISVRKPAIKAYTAKMQRI